MLEFNSAGLLTPPSVIESTIDELEEYFAIDSVENIRRILFTNYLEYNNKLKAICGNISLKQWVDGSFVTKKSRPGDIDLVNFIPFDVAADNEIVLEEFVYPSSLANYGVDGYLVVVYPEHDRRYFGYKANRSYWISQFDRTKPRGEQKGLVKGFLEIII